MKNIDFLPQEIIQQTEARLRMVSRLAVCAAAGGFIILVTSVQTLRYWQLKYELMRLAPLGQQAQILEQQIADAKTELIRTSLHADLVAQLESDWPRTAILNQVLTGLPPRTQLGELHLRYESPQPVSPSPGTTVVVASAPAVARDPLREAYESYRKRAQTRRLVVSLSGITREPGDLHQYVAQLTKRSLVQTAQLLTLEALPQNTYGEQRFTIQIQIRPGFGVPGGPSPGTGTKAPTQRVAQGLATKESGDET